MYRMPTFVRLLHEDGREPVSELLPKYSVYNCSKLNPSHWKAVQQARTFEQQ